MSEEVRIDLYAPIEELRTSLLKLFEMIDNTGTGDVDDTVPYNIKQDVKFGSEKQVREIAKFIIQS
jgi:hypothetical protein